MLVAAPCALMAVDPNADEVITPSAQTAKAAAENASGKAASGLQGPAMLIVAAIIILGAYVFIRRMRNNLGGRLSQSAKGAIDICRVRSLGGKQQFLAVVQVEGKRMLIGIGPGFMTKLSDLEPEDFSIPFERKEPPAGPKKPDITETPTYPFNNLITRINDSISRKDEDGNDTKKR